MRQLLVWTPLAVLLLAGVTSAQTGTQPGRSPADPMSSMWNPQMMIERSVKQATERYHLTPQQEQLARKMTTDGVNAFLDKHEMELRSLVSQAIQARMSGQAPTPDQAKAWAEKAMPLFEEAKKLILDGNRQFRDSLSDEQKKTFDEDQKTMQQQFVTSGDTLGRWSTGGFDPVNDWNPRPVIPNRSHTYSEFDRFDRYARRFISNYKLDSSQASQVLAIAAESRKRAEEYHSSHKADIQTARSRVQELSRDPRNRQQYVEAVRQLTDLNKPVNDLFGEMRDRLDLVPNDSQRKAYNTEVQDHRTAWREQMRRRDPASTAISSASQIATSQGAASRTASSRVAQTQATRPTPAISRTTTTGPALRPVVSRPSKAAGAAK